MRNRWRAGAVLCFVGFALGTTTAWPFTVHDDRGAAVELDTPARRVITLAPFITELIYAAGGGDRLIAVSRYSDYPPAARDLPRIGDAFSVNLEELVALKPDLVMSWESGNNPRITKRLESLGIPVFVLEPRKINDVSRSLRLIGRLLGTERTADDQANSFSRAIERIRDRYAGRRIVRVFYQVARRPLMTLNGRHVFTAIAGLCGGRNVFEDLTPIAPTVNREQVLARDPEVILISSTIKNASDLIDYWSQYPDMTASRTHNIFLVDSDLVNRQTPRLVKGAEQVCGLLDKARRNLAHAGR